jgi:hypothetical protein
MKRSLLHLMKVTGMVGAAVVHYGVAQTSLDQLSNIHPLKGYVKAIGGERLDYNCFNPLATTALLTRCTSGDMDIEWETDPIPADAKGKYVIYKWIVSYSTVTSADISFACSTLVDPPKWQSFYLAKVRNRYT